MIKFFRRVRQRLISENKFYKYLLYAIGEIILVVIGILIALSVNNSNEIRLQKQQEQTYLKALKEEFDYNKEILNKVNNQNKRNSKGTLALIELIGPESPNLDDKKLDELLYEAINNEVQYRPSPGVLLEIINAGKLGSFSDPALKKELASWESELTKVRFQENQEVHKCRMALHDFLKDNTNVRRTTYLSFGQTIGYGNSKFKARATNILRMEEFEILLVNFSIVSYFLSSSYYSSVDKKISTILQLIDSNIE